MTNTIQQILLLIIGVVSVVGAIFGNIYNFYGTQFAICLSSFIVFSLIAGSFNSIKCNDEYVQEEIRKKTATLLITAMTLSYSVVFINA